MSQQESSSLMWRNTKFIEVIDLLSKELNKQKDANKIKNDKNKIDSKEK